MKRIIFIYFLLFGILFVGSNAYSKKVSTTYRIPGRLSRRYTCRDTIVSNGVRMIHFHDSVNTSLHEYILEGFGMSEVSKTAASDLKVIINDQSPKYIHIDPTCKKIGPYRKLEYLPIKETIKKRRDSFVCPDCAQNDPYFFLSFQFLL